MKNKNRTLFEAYTQPKARIILQLDSAHQSCWEPPPFWDSCTLTYKKLIHR